MTRALRPSPMYLTGATNDGARAVRRSSLGLLAQPGNTVLNDVDAGHYAAFGADNGFYGLGAKADPTPELELEAVARWAAWVRAEVAPRAGACLFVTVPDVLRWVAVDGARIPIGDAAGTLARFAELAPVVRELGLPVALVAQDGLELAGDYLVAGDQAVAWADVDVLFVGGSTDWKLGADARAICVEARRRGIWVHVGRVNSWRRLDAVRDYCDSADGTYLAFGPDANLPKLVGWLDALDGDLTCPPSWRASAPRPRPAAQLELVLEVAA